MQLSEMGAHDIRFHEGVILHWYKDSGGTPTIGIGFTWGSMAFRRWWAANRPGQKFAKGAEMTRQECDECLIQVMDGEYGPAVNRFFLGQTVPQNVFDAACSVVYNCGIGALQWQWAKAMQRGEYAEAAALLRTTAVTAKGRRIQGLVDRRAAEARLLSGGIYASGGFSVPDMAPATAQHADRAEQPSKPVSPVIGAAVVAASLPVMTNAHDILHWLWSLL